MNPIKEIIHSKPDLVGFTSDTLAYTKTLKQVKVLKKKINVPFVIGGVHITAMPKSLDPIFDFGVIGEGEETFLETLELFKKKKRFPRASLHKIKSLIFYDNKRLIETPRRPLIKNIDELPFPARDLVPMEEYYLKDQINLFGVKKMGTLMTSRGCPYRCVFCGSPVQWGRVRFHSPEYVVKEIELLVREYKVDGIMFWDDLFIFPESRIEKIANLIKEKDLHKKVTFFGYARANLINEKICNILKGINVKRLIFGLESGSERILGYLKQHSVTVAENRNAIKLCRKYGITTSSGFITGTPGETVFDLKKTYEFMKKYPLDNTQVYILTPYPGTQIWKLAEDKGLVSDRMDFGKLFVQLPPPKLSDFFKEKNLSFIKNRIFLNTEYEKNEEYLNLIFKMQKLAFWQNLKFYLKVIPKDLSLVLRLLMMHTKKLLKRSKRDDAVVN
jgi:radical SAM superfamily enzyme YgiQ (UPF0313 family)